MNIFTLCGDLLHLLSIIILLLKIFTTKSCRGISLNTQSLYAVVFITRYLYLLWNFESMYNWIMKIIFISTACGIVYLMTMHPTISDTYDKKSDSFFLPYLLIPCMILAIITTHDYHPAEILWTFSLWLESIAIVPQLIMVHSMAKEAGGFVDALTSDYVFCLGGYRALYLVNWIYRAITEPQYSNRLAWVAGLVQTLIYCDFFYYYARAKLTGSKMELPI